MLLVSLLIALACLRSVCAQQDVTVPTADPRVVFDGAWVPQDNGGHEFTTTAGASASLSFIGTQVAWHATSNPRGALSRVSVDGASGTLVDASEGTASGDAPVFAVLFSQSGLSPGVSHTIRVTQESSGGLGGPYLEIYNFSYTPSEVASSSSSSSSSVAIAVTTAAGVLPSTPSTQSRMQTSVSPAPSSSASVTKSAPDNDTTATPVFSSSTAPSSSASPSVPISLGAATSGNGAIATATTGSTFLSGGGTATVQQITTVTATANSTLSTSASPPTGAIAGGVVGALALLFILITLFLCWRRRHARNAGNINMQNAAGPVPVAAGPLREGAVAPFRDREDIAVRLGPPRLVIPSALSSEKSNPGALADFDSAPSPYADSTPSPATPHAPATLSTGSEEHGHMLSESQGALSDRSPHSPPSPHSPRFLAGSHIISVLALPVPRSSVPPPRSPTPPPPYVS